jgi:hypothetical protein
MRKGLKEGATRVDGLSEIDEKTLDDLFKTLSKFKKGKTPIASERTKLF